MQRNLLAGALATAFVVVPGPPARAASSDVDDQIRRLSEQVEELRAQVATLSRELDGQRQATASTGASPGAAAVLSTASAAAATASAATGSAAPAGYADTAAGPPAPSPSSALTFTGYGEAVYTAPTDGSNEAVADLRRIVFGAGYQFDERTRFEAEMEVEHAIASADDEGEVAIEQAYISRELGRDMRLQAGLFIIPMGIINERHEPPTFYGVDRPFVETAIIPSTWRDGGLSLQGDTAVGLQWAAGITTGFALANWDPASADGIESPLGSIHQEMSFAKAADLSGFGSVRYTGVPGLALGAAVFTGGAASGAPDSFPADDAWATLWSGHVRWTPGDWELTALYAEGHISDTADLNLTFIGNPTLVPKRFWGAYGQVAYRGWSVGSMRVEPFLRYEQVNTAAEYADIGEGLTPAALPTMTAATFGTTLRLTPDVVFKLDYQDFHDAPPELGLVDRFNLGVGYMY
jgi:hypothetical protein